MLGSTTTGAGRALVTPGSARSRDADPYRRYAAGLYRQALLTRGEPALAGPAVCDVIVNERALALIPERAEDDAISPRHLAALWHAVIRRRERSGWWRSDRCRKS